MSNCDKFEGKLLGYVRTSNSLVEIISKEGETELETLQRYANLYHVPKSQFVPVRKSRSK